jgi:hypothetical protein
MILSNVSYIPNFTPFILKLPVLSKVVDVVFLDPSNNNRRNSGNIEVIFSHDKNNNYGSKDVKFMILDNVESYPTYVDGYKYLKSITESVSTLASGSAMSINLSQIVHRYYVFYDETCLLEMRDEKIEKIIE